MNNLNNISNDISKSFNNIDIGWSNILSEIWSMRKDKIIENITSDLSKYDNQLELYPPPSDIFKAFELCKYNDLKVVIIGMDPYINKDEAHGLAFSVSKATTMPPSLRNIFKELRRSFNINRQNTDLTDWAKQGVLLLNTALTVRQGCSGSHTGIWKEFTRDLISKIGKATHNCVYLLWGNHAQAFEQYIDSTNNLILKHTHPSPLSRKPFEGNNHFVLCNDYLLKLGKPPITWVIDYNQ